MSTPSKPILYACTVCNIGWDHYPEGDEEYGCDQEVELEDGEVVYPHDYVSVDEWKVRNRTEFGRPEASITADVVPQEPQFFSTDPLMQALSALDDATLARLSTLPVEKVWNEVVEGRIIPNRATRRAAARKNGRR